MKELLKKDRPYNGNYISDFLLEAKNTVSTERTTITNDRKNILEVFGNTIKNTKSYLNLPTDSKIQDKLGNIVKDLENTLTNDVKLINDLFDYLKNEQDNANIILNKQQSFIRNHIKNNPIIQSRINADMEQPLGIKDFFNDIITTRWNIIGLPDEHGNRIVKDERNYQYYIDPKNNILINAHRHFTPHKYIIGGHTGSLGGTPFRIYTKDGELIVGRIQYYKEISEYEYYVSVGPRKRDTTDKPSSVHTKITIKTPDDKDVVLYIDDFAQRSFADGKLHVIDKNSYKEWSKEPEEKLPMH